MMNVGAAAWTVPDARSRSAQLEYFFVQLAVVFAPFMSIRAPGILLTLSDFLFMISLSLRLLSGGMPLRPFGPGNVIWMGGLVMLVGDLIISSILFGDPLRGIVVGAQYTFGMLFLPMALLRRPQEQVDRLLVCGVIGMILVCLIGLYSYVTGNGIGAPGEQFETVTGNGRIASLLADANALAGMVALTVPLLAYTLIVKKIWLPIGLGIYVLFAFTIVLASSNSGLLVFALATGAFLLGRLKVSTLAGGLVLAVIAAIVLRFFGDALLPAIFVKRVLPALTSGDISQAGTFTGRLELIKEAASMAHEHLIFGLGADQFRVVSEQRAPVHNLYLILWVEGGLPSMLGWMICLIGAVVTALVDAKNRRTGVTLLVTVTSAGALAALAMTFPHMYARHLIVPLLLSVSPAVAVARRVVTYVQPAAAALLPSPR
jgi:O-antigen ligase